MELVVAGRAGDAGQAVVVGVEDAIADAALLHSLELAIHVLFPELHSVKDGCILGKGVELSQFHGTALDQHRHTHMLMLLPWWTAWRPFAAPSAASSSQTHPGDRT